MFYARAMLMRGHTARLHEAVRRPEAPRAASEGREGGARTGEGKEGRALAPSVPPPLALAAPRGTPRGTPRGALLGRGEQPGRVEARRGRGRGEAVRPHVTPAQDGVFLFSLTKPCFQLMKGVGQGEMTRW